MMPVGPLMIEHRFLKDDQGDPTEFEALGADRHSTDVHSSACLGGRILLPAAHAV